VEIKGAIIIKEEIISEVIKVVEEECHL